MVVGGGFDAAGPVLGLTPASSYGLQGEHSFAALAAAVSQDRHVLMGLFEGDRLRLNPPKDERFSIEPHTQLVIIS